MRKVMRCLRWIAIDILFVAMFMMSVGAAMIIADFIGATVSAETGRMLVGFALIAALPMIVILAMARAMRRSVSRYYGFIYNVPDTTSDDSDEDEIEQIESEDEEVAEEDAETSEEKSDLDLKEIGISEDEPYEAKSED